MTSLKINSATGRTALAFGLAGGATIRLEATAENAAKALDATLNQKVDWVIVEGLAEAAAIRRVAISEVKSSAAITMPASLDCYDILTLVGGNGTSTEWCLSLDAMRLGDETLISALFRALAGGDRRGIVENGRFDFVDADGEEISIDLAGANALIVGSATLAPDRWRAADAALIEA